MVQATIEFRRDKHVFAVCESRDGGHNIKFTTYDGLSERSTKYEMAVIFGGPGRDKDSDTVYISLKRTVKNNGVVSAVNNPEGFTVRGDEAKALYADFGHSADSQAIALFGKVIDLAKLHFAGRYAKGVLEYGGAGAVEAMVITTELVLLEQGVHDAKFIEPEKREAVLRQFGDWLRQDLSESV